MKKAAVSLLKLILNFIYFFMKLRVTRPGKVVFLSRQSDELTEDFRMVQEELTRREPWIQIVTVCSRLEGANDGGLLKFGWDTLRSMRHMADAGVVILDAYWPAVSILKHKKSLKVIQMWHAMGKIKQSGYQTLGKASGRSAETARLMNMHQGYDYIIAGGKAWNPFYCASFGTTEDKLVNIGLPRIDFLLNTAEENREKVRRLYPEFEGKQILVYAPTFRRGIDLKWEALVENLTGGNRVLVVKPHPNQKLAVTEEMKAKGVFLCEELSSVEMLSSADYLITDYSAIAVEAAVLGINTLYYVPDFGEYTEKNGMNIDLFTEMPGCVFENAEELSEVIRKNAYNTEAKRRYREKFLPEELGTSTEKIADLILSLID